MKSLVYPLLYMILFDLIFLPWFSDSGQTTAVFILLSLYASTAGTLIGLAVSKLYHLGFKTHVNAYLAIALMCVFTGIFAGDYLLFGLVEKLKTDQEVSVFRQKRDIALSCSALLSGISTGIIERIRSKNAI